MVGSVHAKADESQGGLVHQNLKLLIALFYPDMRKDQRVPFAEALGGAREYLAECKAVHPGIFERGHGVLEANGQLLPSATRFRAQLFHLAERDHARISYPHGADQITIAHFYIQDSVLSILHCGKYR